SGDLEFLGQRAATFGFHRGIVVAGDPDPFGCAGQRGEHPGGMRFQPARSRRVVEVVPQREDPPRVRLADRQSHPFERLAAVVWGQQLAVAGEKARLLEVQVGDQQRPLARPVQRPAGGEPELLAAEIERKGNHAPSLPRLPGFGKGAVMDWQPHTARAREWFEDLRTRICTEFEAIERDAGSEATFDYISWQREEEGNPDPGGGVRGVMKGRVFEKVGVNVSTVAGTFAPEFAR